MTPSRYRVPPPHRFGFGGLYRIYTRLYLSPGSPGWVPMPLLSRVRNLVSPLCTSEWVLFKIHLGGDSFLEQRRLLFYKG